MKLVTNEVVEERVRGIATFYNFDRPSDRVARYSDQPYPHTSPHDHSSARPHEQITPQGFADDLSHQRYREAMRITR